VVSSDYTKGKAPFVLTNPQQTLHFIFFEETTMANSTRKRIRMADILNVKVPAITTVAVTTKSIAIEPEIKAPAKRVLAAKAPAKQVPAAKAPAKQVPAAKAPAKQVPAAKAPAKQVPAVKAPAKQVPAVKAPAKQAPAVKAPAKQAPAVKAPAKQVPAAKAPAKQVPAVKAPAKQVPAVKAPAKQAPAVKAPAKQVPAAIVSDAAMPPTQVVKKPARKLSQAQIKKAALQASIDDALGTGTYLARQHEDYIEQYVTKGSVALNLLLTEIMAFAEKILANDNVEAVINALRKDLKNTHGIRGLKNSSNLIVIVRYVTRTNRKNAHVYTRVLEKAFEAKKTSAELNDFIVENGGVSKLRLSEVECAAERRRKRSRHGILLYTRDLLNKNAKDNPMGHFTVASENKPNFHDMTTGSEFCYMICQYVDGQYAVVDAVTCVDKELEERILCNYFNYQYQRVANRNGTGEADKIFRQRMQENIDRYNEWNKHYGRKLWDFLGYEID
jgi:hypothetical protein